MSKMETELKNMHEKFVADVKSIIKINCPNLNELTVTYMALIIYQRYTEDQKAAIRLSVDDIEESLMKEFGVNA